MPVANARKHQVPAAGDAPSRAGVVGPFETINDIVPVANSTDRANVATAVAPTASRPLYVHRADAPVGQELEVTTDGSNWRTILAYRGTSTWTFERTSANVSDNFPSGAMTSLISATITDAPIGRYWISGLLIMSAAAATSGNLRMSVGAVNLSEDMRADLNTQARPSQFTGTFGHNGGNLVLNLQFQTGSQVGTVLTNGSRISVALVGP
jgi:hypothetical protein